MIKVRTATAQTATRIFSRTAGAALALIAITACGNKQKSAMTICQELTALGLAAECRDTSTACKYARERVTFDLPGTQKVGGQVMRFNDDAQYNAMLKIAKLAKDRVAEAPTALTLVQFVSTAPEDAAARAQGILAALPPAPRGKDAPPPDPNCK